MLLIKGVLDKEFQCNTAPITTIEIYQVWPRPRRHYGPSICMEEDKIELTYPWFMRKCAGLLASRRCFNQSLFGQGCKSAHVISPHAQYVHDVTTDSSSQGKVMLKSSSLEGTELFAVTSDVFQCLRPLILESTCYAQATCACKGLPQ
jgi:hypothetical protein